MNGCAAPFCNNSVAKGYILKVFPRNCERYALWAKNVGERCWGNDVKNWMPATANSFFAYVISICNVRNLFVNAFKIIHFNFTVEI